MRFGRSRTCSSRLNDLRARGETTIVVKKSSLPWTCEIRQVIGGRTGERDARTPKRGATSQGTGKTPPTASRSLGGSRYWVRTVARPERSGKQKSGAWHQGCQAPASFPT